MKKLPNNTIYLLTNIINVKQLSIFDIAKTFNTILHKAIF
jgi:hypothetical protein